MNIDFKKMFSQAIEQIEKAQQILDGLVEIREKVKKNLYGSTLYDQDEGEKLMEILNELEYYEQNYQMLMRYSILVSYDVILGIAKEKCTAEDLRKFMFGGNSIEEINKIPTKDLVNF